MSGSRRAFLSGALAIPAAAALPAFPVDRVKEAAGGLPLSIMTPALSSSILR